MKYFLFALSLFFAGSCKPKVAEEKKPAPNVVIVFTDDQGYQDLSCFGSPNIYTIGGYLIIISFIHSLIFLILFSAEG